MWRFPPKALCCKCRSLCFLLTFGLEFSSKRRAAGWSLGGEEGLRPGPHRQRGESGIGTWTVFTGHLKPGSRTPSGEQGQRRVGVGAGNCIGVRVRPGSRTPSGEQGQRRSALAVGSSGRPGRTRVEARQPSSQATAKDGAVVWSRKIWGHPNWTQ